MTSAKINGQKPLETLIKQWLKAIEAPYPCVVSISGSLRGADVCVAPDAPPLAIQGTLYLVSGQTTIHKNAAVTMGLISWSENNEPRLAAGRLTNLVADEVLAHLIKQGPDAAAKTVPPGPAHEHAWRTIDEELDDIPSLDRTETAMPALGAQRGSQTERITQQIPPIESNKATGGDGWQAMIQASDELSQASSAAESLERNDIILHPRFGRCVVARPPMFGKLKVRRPTGALLDLHLKVLHLQRMPDENGQRVFSIKIKGR